MLRLRLAERAARRRRRRDARRCSSATPTSSPRSAPVACSTTSSPPSAVPLTRLTEIFRQAARSLIVRAAHAINARRAAADARPARRRAARLLLRRRATARRRSSTRSSRSRPSACRATTASTRAPTCRCSRRCTAAPSASRRSTPRCARALNPDGEPIPGTALRVGDRVMQTAQRPRARADERRDRRHRRATTPTRDRVTARHRRRPPRSRCRRARWRRCARRTRCRSTRPRAAVAPAVIVPLFRGHHVMLTRNLVYTALTRAERMAACSWASARALDGAAARRRSAPPHPPGRARARRVTCEDLRDHCPALRRGDGWSGEYSYLAPATSPDDGP